MNKSRLLVFRVVSIMALLGMFATPGISYARTVAQEQKPEHQKQFQKVPEDVQLLFKGGMPVDRFLALNGGQIPDALKDLAGQEVTVVVQMEAQPLASFYAKQRASKEAVSAQSQKDYLNDLKSNQDAVASGVENLGGRVISRYTKAYNGLLVQVPASQLAEIQTMPGVLAVREAPEDVPALENSVNLIRASQVIQELGIDGTGTTIAVIDTGVDYTHAAFGGPGTPEAYAANDPTVIEDGTFPTEKVIGGYDFAGAEYNPCGTPAVDTPNPDPDPLDGSGHGTHVADIAAGLDVPDKLSHGVAPGAKVYALKVFGEPAGCTNLAVNAIEWALDPNGDGDLSDHVDVINMSLGSDYGIASLLDPEIVAVDYASSIGVVVVAAAGNAGDVAYITGTPAAADSAISVAASTTGFVTGPTITVPDSVDVPRHQIIYNPGNFDYDTGGFPDPVSATLMYVGNLFDTDTLCTIPDSAAGTTPLAGAIALIQRGDCTFTEKVNNAADLGAAAAIIFNHEEGGNTLVTMVGDPVNIPAGFVAHDDGLLLIQVDGVTVTISADTDVTSIPDPYVPADTIADFSSRGPRGLDAFQKPDVTAPGVSIYAAKMGSGDEGTSFSGTSMATPHVSGVAALVRQAHPDWSAEQVKAAIMNTAVDLQPGSAEVPRQGAGRVDAYRAVTTDAFAIGDQDLVSLSWGIIPIDQSTYQDTKSVALHDLSGGAKTYDVRVDWGENSLTDGVTLTVPDSVKVTAKEHFAYFDVNLAIDASQVPVGFNQLEEYYGYVVMTNKADGNDRLRVPFYLIPQPHSDIIIADVKHSTDKTRVTVTNNGPVPANLWAYPLYENSENDPAVSDMADLRMVGMDAGYSTPDYGDLFIPAIDVYGSWFTPQPYFAEFDLALDINKSPDPEFIDFNWNAGAAFGTGDDDVWVVVQYDVASGLLFLGSPYIIYTDYNTGYMEWYLPTAWHGLDGDKDFNWQLTAYDFNGNTDVTGLHYFDTAHLPLTWIIDNAQPGPGETAGILARIRNFAAYRRTNVLGLMVVDYNGEPGTGQAFDVPLH